MFLMLIVLRLQEAFTIGMVNTRWCTLLIIMREDCSTGGARVKAVLFEPPCIIIERYSNYIRSHDQSCCCYNE